MFYQIKFVAKFTKSKIVANSLTNGPPPIDEFFILICYIISFHTFWFDISIFKFGIERQWFL